METLLVGYEEKTSNPCQTLLHHYYLDLSTNYLRLIFQGHCLLLTLSNIQTPLQQTTFENTVAKGEFAHDEQFHLLPQYFQPIH